MIRAAGMVLGRNQLVEGGGGGGRYCGYYELWVLMWVISQREDSNTRSAVISCMSDADSNDSWVVVVCGRIVKSQ